MSTEIVVLSRTEFETTLERVARQAAEAVMAKISTTRNDRMLKPAEVANLLGISEYNLLNVASLQRGFPASINVGTGEKRQTRRWLESSIIEWMEREAA